MLDHPRDLLADFLRFYRCRPADLSAEEFTALAYRVAAYGGMIAHRAQRDQPAPVRSGARQVPGNKAAILADPLLREVVSFGKG